MEKTFLRTKFMCTLLVMSLIFSVAMLSAGVQASPGPTRLYVDPSKVKYWAPAFSEIFTINVSVANVTGLQGFGFKLYWNTTLLDLVEINANYTNSFLPPSWFNITREIHEDQGWCWLGIMSRSKQPANGSGRLAAISFKVTHCAIRPEIFTSALHLAETRLYNPSFGLIPHDVGDSEYWCYSTPFLWVTAKTDKPYYRLQEYGNITVYGNLTAGFSPVQDGLVALQVDKPQNQIVVIRTLSTGTPPASQIIEIVSLIPCDDWGNPKNNFYRGSPAYFKITLKNNDNKTRKVLAAINAYDAGNTPFGSTTWEVNVAAGATIYAVKNIPIPETASVGQARVYASALTGWPKDGGTAYCHEKNATFNIENSTAGTPSPTIESGGNYSLTFKLPPDATVGIYRAYASSAYQGRSTMSSMAFGVNVIRVPAHYSTIQGAVNAASPTNNSILVLPGTYNEHVTMTKSLTLVGRDPSITIINGGGTGTVVTVTAGSVTFSRFKIQNGGSSFPNSGIALKNSSITISENIVLKNYYGINVNSSNNNFILDNTVSRNNYGIYLNRSTGNTLSGNSMICNKYNFGVSGDSTSHFTHTINASNTVNRKSVIYWTNKHDDAVPSNAGFVAIVSSTNITVRDLELTKNVQGVLFAFTSNSVIERVNTLNNEYGIYLAYSYGNTIIGSRVSNNSVGVYLRNSNESTIYHNNFINNVNQIQRYQSSNTWDDGGIWLCPICGELQPKGNYWSGYAGLDNGTHTQAHNCPGDGVGDTLTPHLGVDKYPLMNPWILVHDIAITSVACEIPFNSTLVYRGWKVNVTVTLKNKGDSIETFNVSAYANTSLVQTKTVALLVRSSKTVILIWDTKGIAKGSYVISADAATVPGETNTSDNTYIYGTVKVTTADLNGDGKVNIKDIGIIAVAFGSKPGDPNWNPVADVYVDGKITIKDIGIVSIHFGEYV